MVTVSIVLYGAASVIFQGFERAGHLKLHAEAEQVGHLRPFVGFQLLGHLDGTLVIDDIGQGQLSLNGGNVISGLYYGQSVFTTLFEGSQFQFGIEPYAVAVLESCTEVIVRGGAPEVGLQDAAFFQVGQSVGFVEAKEAIVFVEFDAEILARHDEVVAVVFADDRLYHLFVVSGFVGESLGGRFVGIQHQLVSGYGMSGGQQTIVGLQFIGDVEQPLGMLAIRTDGQGEDGGLMGSHVEVIYATGTHHTAVFQHFPFQVVAGEIAEEVLVIYLHLSLFQVYRSGPDVLIEVLHLVGVRVWHAVGTDEAVVAEVDVAGVKLVEVTAVSIDQFAVGAYLMDTLVHKVPDEAALVFGILPYQVPVFFEAAHRVAHGVGVFGLDQGLCLGVILAISAALVIGVVHRAIDVRLAVVAGAFILHGTAGVFGLYPVIGGLEVGTVAGLVAKGPEDDAGMVEVTLHVALVTLQVGLAVVGALGQGFVSVAHAVRFEIGFGHHVESVFVTQGIPIRVVRIVAGTYGVDVEVLHHLYVLQHPLAGHHVAAVRIHLVTVGALEEDRLPVDQYLRVLQFDFAEAHFHGDDLCRSQFAYLRVERI